MKIVIDISKKYYEMLKFEGQQPNAHVFAKLVASGTPLPKGHGDLIDRSKIEWYGCNFEGSRTCRDNNGNCDICDHAECYAKQVRELQAIIEADKEE